jgi:ABC-type sugar transport system ATPase subunit
MTDHKVLYAYLTIMTGNRAGTNFPLDPARESVIGRGTDCHISIPDPISSREHAVIVRQDDVHRLFAQRDAVHGLWKRVDVGDTEIALAADHAVEHAGKRSRVHLELDLGTRAKVLAEDRRQHGLIIPMPIAANISLPNLRRYTNRAGLIQPKHENSIAEDYRQRLAIPFDSAGIAGDLDARCAD